MGGWRSAQARTPTAQAGTARQRAAQWRTAEECSMPPAGGPNLWSVSLASPRTRRPRWLGDNGRFTSDPARALRLVSPEVAAQRVQHFLQIHGWEPAVMERLQLVPAPPAPAAAVGATAAERLRRRGQPPEADGALAA